MKHIPIIFPISLAVITFFLVLSGAYAISESAVSTEVVSSEDGNVVQFNQLKWHQKTAVWVCPLH